MADALTALSSDVTVAYLDENRQKRIYWTGTTGLHKMNALYSALMDHFDEPTRMDNPSPMSAQTPVEYTTGIIDTGDDEPWYVQYELMEHMQEGALRTSGWTRDLPGDGTGAVGIVIAPVTAAGNTIVPGDEGLTITHADGDSGTLLEVISNGGTNDYLVIRPASNALANDFNSTSGNLTCNAHTGAQNAAAVTGEQIWANLYSIGTIEDDTHIYLYQGDIADNSRTHFYSVNDNTQDYWGDGHIDVCVPIRDWQTASAPIIDQGYLTAFARKGTTEYAFFITATSTTSGGRNPVPLGTKADLNNTAGTSQVTLSGASTTAGHWNVGDEILGATSGARAIITEVLAGDLTATPTFEYYLIDDPQTDFNGSEAINNQDASGTSTGSGATSASGPALATWFTSNTAPTITFGNTTFDTDDDGTDEYYALNIDCNQNPLSEVYEWLKYITGRGYTTKLHVTGASTGIEGEQYIGADVYLKYSGTVTGTIAEGDDVTQATTLAEGVVLSHDTTNKVILLRNSRGTFNTTNLITSTDNSGTVTADTAAIPFAPNAVSPFGTFAGGTFFGARGILISDWLSADENSFQLTPAEGGTKSRPIAITLTVSNLVGTDESTATDDRVAIFRLTGAGGQINKTEYSATGGEAVGSATLALDTPITQDTPGKTTGGVVKIRDASDNNKEYRIRFSSWNNTTNTPNGEVVYANFAAFTASGGTTTTVDYATGGFTAGVKRGDLVYNSTQGEVVYVKSVVSDTQITVEPAFTSASSGDTVEINCNPVIIAAGDDAYIPLLDTYASAATASASIVYSAPIFFRVVARNSANATKIVPFTTDDTTSGTDRSSSVVRNTDTIIS